jgi:hypothetical protein
MVWIASSTLLLPPRMSSAEARFGSAYPDARPLCFGWGCGVLPVFGALLLMLIAVLLVKRRGEPTRPAHHMLNLTLTVGWALLLSAGLIYALAGPIP